MAISAMSILSGIGAAAAGLAGDKVSKTGSIPGLDLAAIIPALIGKSSGSSSLLGTLTSVASKTGLLKNLDIGKLAELAGTLITFTGKTPAKTESTDGIAGLAAAIMGGSGTGSSLATIATLASKLGSTAKDDKSLTGMASDLGKTLASKFGVSFSGTGTQVKALDKVLEHDTKTTLFESILKGIIK